MSPLFYSAVLWTFSNTVFLISRHFKEKPVFSVNSAIISFKKVTLLF